jgi:ferritin-like metal-binding protein YciE
MVIENSTFTLQIVIFLNLTLKGIKFIFLEGTEPMDSKTVHNLLIKEMKELYASEHHLSKLLPQMAQAADHTELKSAFEKCLAKTKGHTIRLEITFEMLGLNPSRKACKAMRDVVLQGTKVVEKYREDRVKDAALISAAQGIGHYKITDYGTAYTFANILGNHDIADLFQHMLTEEKQVHEHLAEIAQKINSPIAV